MEKQVPYPSLPGDAESKLDPGLLTSVCVGFATCVFKSPASLFSVWPSGCRTHSTQMWDQFTSISQSCPTLFDPMDCSMLGLPVHHQLAELAQTHVHRVSDAIQPSHPLLSPSPPAFNFSQHQGLFQWVSYLHQVVKVLEFQHQSFQWAPRTDLL